MEGRHKVSEIFKDDYGEEFDYVGRRYLVGDTVDLSLNIEHQMNLVSCEVTFSNASIDEAITMTFFGFPEQFEITDTGMKRSAVQLSEEVGIEHIPGEYFLAYIEVYTASGQTFRYEHDISALQGVGWSEFGSRKTSFGRRYNKPGEGLRRPGRRPRRDPDQHIVGYEPPIIGPVPIFVIEAELETVSGLNLDFADLDEEQQ